MVDLLTHEIKNPLNTINYAFKFVQSDGIQRDEMQDRIKKISYSASRIDSIVNQVYLSTRIDRYEQNKKPLNEQINFNELITEVVSDYEFGNSFEINTNKNLYLRNSRFFLPVLLPT
jgi:signal transduction histidine kinase